MNETKIYIIKFKNIPNVVYIGNTHLDLNIRLRNHKYSITTLYKYIEKNKIDWDDVSIELYENFKYDNRYEYEKKEEEVIKTFLNDLNYIVINCSKTGGSPTKQILKEIEYYLISNLKDIIQENIYDYYGDINIKKEKVKLLSSNNYYKNRDKKLKEMEEYRKKNKELLYKNANEKVKCECGCEIRKSYLLKHKKTKIHLLFMEYL